MGKTVLEVIFVLFLRGLGAIGMLGVTAVAARLMSPEESGTFFLGMTVLLVVTPISLFGLPPYCLRLVGARDLADQAGEIRHIAARSRAVALLTTSVSALALAVASYYLSKFIFVNEQLQRPLVWLAPAVIATGMGMLISHHFQGIRFHLRSIFTLAIGAPVLAIAGMIGYPIFSGEQLTPTVASQVYSAACWANLVIALVLWGYSLPPCVGRPIDWSGAKSACSAFWSVQVMVLLVAWSGQLAAGAWVSSPEYAQLTVAHRLANVVNFLLVGVNFVVAPKLSRFWSEGEREKLQTLVTKAAFATSLIALPLMLAMVFFSESIMGLVRPEFSSGWQLLAILAVAQFHNVATGSVNTLLAMCGYEQELRKIVFTSGGCAIVLSIVLTWKFGVTGAALATALSLILQNSLAMWGVRRYLGFWMFDRFLFWRSNP